MIINLYKLEKNNKKGGAKNEKYNKNNSIFYDSIR